MRTAVSLFALLRPSLVLAALLLLPACARRTPPAATDSNEEWLQSMSAGWLGCQPERVAITEARAVASDSGSPTAWTWVARCEDVSMVCTSAGESQCSPLRAGDDAPVTAPDAEPPRVTRALPPEVVACTEEPVAVEGLFDNVGRLVELRPWPGETPEQRTCVTRALEDIELPEGQSALVRFEPRDPWADDD